MNYYNNLYSKNQEKNILLPTFSFCSSFSIFLSFSSLFILTKKRIMPLVSTLIQKTNDLAHPAIQQIIQLYATYLLPQAQRHKNALVPIGTIAAIALGIYRFYTKISRAPAHLQHMPQCDYFTALKYYFTNGLVHEYARDVVEPIRDNSAGVYTRITAEGWIVDITDPVAAKQMLMKADLFPKSITTRGAKGTLIERFVGGPNVIFLNGLDWKRHRKIANPAFHRAFPVKTFGHLTQTLFKVVEDGDVDVMDIFTRLTLDAIGTAGFGFNFNALIDKHNEWVEGYERVRDGMMKPLYILLPILDTKLVHWFPKRQEAHQSLTNFLNMLDKIIINKRETIQEKRDKQIEDNEKDLLSLMIESEMNEEDGAVMSNEELKSNLCVFFLAGHDTTAFALSCAIYELAKHPDVQEKVRQEVNSILGDASETVLPTVEQTKQMSYLNQVMKETLRLHAPLANSTSRTAAEDIELNGVFIPKGQLVGLDIYNLHRNPKCWKDPETFDPDRFAPGGEAEKQPGSGLAWVAFSNGGRQCIGVNFSLAQQRVVLSMLVRKYNFEIPEDSIHKEQIQKRNIIFSMISIDDLKIKFKSRY
ncbi:cytochrome P450 [Phascolomyces articulosus]|uniref:Cytochrome P450 n=1 Tax=Phascolomyces articulosus TaxID=60185 RepID=A0AAD5PAB3_9FUNG|nr:cytochrome P450 [Phascolomyces articulosus]